MRIRVLIVDPGRLERAGLRAFLETQEGIQVVAEASSGKEAVQVVRGLQVDVVLMELELARADGLEAVRTLAGGAGTRAVKVLVMGADDLGEHMYDVLAAGAQGLVGKRAATAELVVAVQAAAIAGTFLESACAVRLGRDLVRLARPRAVGSGRLGMLTEREREVLGHIARGLSNAEIAGALHVAETTVRTHVAHLLAKLCLRDRVQAASLAYEAGLVQAGTDAAASC